MKTFTKKAIRQALFLLSFCWSLNYAMSNSGESHNRSGFLPNTNAGDFLSSWEYDESFLTPEKQTACQTHYPEKKCENSHALWGSFILINEVCEPNTLLQCLESARYNISADQITACGKHPNEYHGKYKVDADWPDIYLNPSVYRYKYSSRIQCLESAIQYNLSFDQITACGHYEDPIACLNRAGQQNISFDQITACEHYEYPKACLDIAGQQNISHEKVTACSEYEDRFLQKECLIRAEQYNINPAILTFCGWFDDSINCLEKALQYKADAESFLQNMVSWKIVPLPY